MTKFDVAPVEPGKLSRIKVSPRQALNHIFGSSIEIEDAGARSASLIAGDIHGFVDAVGFAYSDHLPLVLSPDDVWLMVVQGFANATRALAAEDRVTLTVRRDDFALGASNPWPEVFSTFSEQIRQHLGNHRHKLFICDFSTTGTLERTACDVVLMGAMKNCFTYEFESLCGIPEIRLLGTEEDWHDVRIRAEILCEQGLNWWSKVLLPVLDAFVDASAGEVDRPFWNSLFKINDTSGGPYITGWINTLLPFIERDGELIPNPSAKAWSSGMNEECGGGPTKDSLPAPMMLAPVLWRYLGSEISLSFCAGFLGVEHLPDGAVRPGLGWGVLHGLSP